MYMYSGVVVIVVVVEREGNIYNVILAVKLCFI